IVAAIRRRSEAGGGDAAQLPGALLRQRHAVLRRAFPLAVFGQDQAQGEGIYLRDDLKSPRLSAEAAFWRRRMRGEVGLRSNPGEGDSPRARLSPFSRIEAPHPDPLSVRTG